MPMPAVSADSSQRAVRGLVATIAAHYRLKAEPITPPENWEQCLSNGPFLMCWRPSPRGAEFHLWQFPSGGGLFTGVGMRVRSDLINGLHKRFGATWIEKCKWQFALPERWRRGRRGQAAIRSPAPEGECVAVSQVDE
jgi:hypothetical protein